MQQHDCKNKQLQKDVAPHCMTRQQYNVQLLLHAVLPEMLHSLQPVLRTIDESIQI